MNPPEAPGPLTRGVTLERTFQGLEVRLRNTGPGRFFGAAFLAVWLAGWAVGEAFALWILGMGAWSLFTGSPPGPGRDPLEPAPALAAGAFLIVWTAFWTVGGWAALREFLGLLWGEDRLCATPQGLEVERRAGFLVRRKLHPRDRLRRLYRLESGRALVADTQDGPVELSRLGHGHQAAIIGALTAELGLPDPSTWPASLPGDWQEVNTPEGGTLLVKNVATRRTQARVAWAIALTLWAGTMTVGHAASGDRSLITLAVVAVATASAVTWGAGWLQFARIEWRIETGRIIQQRRFGSRVQRRFEGTSLLLSETHDSDNDAWYAVELAAPVGPTATPKEQRRSRRQVLSRIHDPTEPRQLAEWLARRAKMPLVDSVPSPAAKAAEADKLLRQLEDTGRFGRWAARLLERRVRKQPD